MKTDDWSKAMRISRRGLMLGGMAVAPSLVFPAVTLPGGASMMGPIERLLVERDALIVRLNREVDGDEVNRLAALLASLSDHIASEPVTGPADMAAKMRFLRDEVLAGTSEGLVIPTLDSCLTALSGAV